PAAMNLTGGGNGVFVYGGTLAITAPTSGLSAIGALNVFLGNDATFRYGAPGSTTTRQFTLLGSGGTLDLTGSALQLTGTGTPVKSLFGTGALTLAGGT